MAPEKLFLNVSDLSTYVYCPRKLWLLKNAKIKEIETGAKVMGSIMHEINDNITKHELEVISQIRTHDIEKIASALRSYHAYHLSKIIKKYRKKISELGIDIITFSKMINSFLDKEVKKRTHQINVAIKKFKVYGEDLVPFLYPKKYTEFLIRSPRLGLKGIIDVVEEYEDHVNIIEMKTTLLKDPVPYHRIQLYAYMVMMKEYSEKQIFGKLYYINKDNNKVNTFSYKFNPFMEMEVQHTISQIHNMLTGPIPKILNNDRCVHCPLRTLCYEYNP